MAQSDWWESPKPAGFAPYVDPQRPSFFVSDATGGAQTPPGFSESWAIWLR
jgi:hypothetical protein